jgi:hypothetical protein
MIFSRIVFTKCPVWIPGSAVHVIDTRKIRNTQAYTAMKIEEKAEG